jgi:hypothetical protein
MQNKPSARDHQWTSLTPTPSPSRVESGDHKEKWAMRLAGESRSRVCSGESRDLRGEGSTAACEW